MWEDDPSCLDNADALLDRLTYELRVLRAGVMLENVRAHTCINISMRRTASIP